MDIINNNKVFVGFASLLFNLGAKHLTSDLGKVHDYLLNTPVIKFLVIFSLFFLATRDVAISVALSLGYAVLFLGMLHEEGFLSAIPRDVRMKLQSESVG